MSIKRCTGATRGYFGELPHLPKPLDNLMVGVSIRAERKIVVPPLEVYASASTLQLFWSFFIVFSAAIFEWPDTS